MLTNPDLDEIVYGPRGMLNGIDACIETQCLVSALTLIYSAIDAISALTRPLDSEKTNREVFKQWVAKHMKPSERLGCRPEDIYAARCGVLHTYSPDADLVRRGEAKPLVYRWKNGPAPDPQLASQIPENALVICIDDLSETLRVAVGDFIETLANDSESWSRVEYHVRSLLCYRPWTPVEIQVAA